MKNRSRSFSVLASALCSAVIAVSCEGSETDNPVSTLPDVFDGTSPETFTPEPGGAPPCTPPDTDDLANMPTGLARSVVVPTASGSVIASGSYASGLQLIDASNPEHNVVLSQGVVTGYIRQLLVASSGELWVVATEAPRVDGNAVPKRASLEPTMRLVRVDVSDPAHPVRIAEATLEGDLWELRERNGDIWVLTARLRAELRGCDSPLNQPYSCVFPSYDTLLVHGFRPSGLELEPIGQAELPFEQRAWWGSDGVVTALGDGTLHVAEWDSSGALLAPLALELGASGIGAGPADVVSHELSIVQVSEGQESLDVYDLDAITSVPTRSFSLGSRARPAAGYSLFAKQHLWLQADEGSGDAEVWDLTQTTPAQVALPLPFLAVVPIEGAVRTGHDGEVLALGWMPDPNGGASVSLLSIQGSQVSVLDAPGLEADFVSVGGNLSNGLAAPDGVQGDGEASGWVLRARGTSLPIGVDPEVFGNTTLTSAFVMVDPDGALQEGAAGVSDANVGEAALVEARDPMHPDAWSLELTRDGSTQVLDVPPEMRRLIPTRKGLVSVATAPSGQCAQSSADCIGYAPGVSVFDFSGEARLLASLPFPEIPLPVPSDPNHLSVTWDLYNPVTAEQPAALEISERELAFVAQVDLSCDSPETCDAFDIEAVPVGEANVAFGTIVACPPAGAAPDCVDTPSPVPTVFGTGQRQYFYVLDLDAPGGPAWQSWGVSGLTATARRTDRDSRFAAPIATDGVLATTRLERRRSATDVNDAGATHFFLDRFERSAMGDVVALPPVNVPGYAVARLGGNEALERWVTVEAAPGQTGEARLYRVNVRSDGARIERQLDLGGTFAGFRMLSSDSEVRLGLVLSKPDDACGVTRLSTLRLGTTGGDADEPLEIAGTLELPSDDWGIAAIDRDLAVVRHGSLYVLVRVGADGTPGVVSSRAVDVLLDNEQLLGTNLFGAADYSGHRSIDFSSDR